MNSLTSVGALPETLRRDHLDALAERVEGIVAREASFRVPKVAGFFVAEVG